MDPIILDDVLEAVVELFNATTPHHEPPAGAILAAYEALKAYFLPAGAQPAPAPAQLLQVDYAALQTPDDVHRRWEEVSRGLSRLVIMMQLRQLAGNHNEAALRRRHALTLMLEAVQLAARQLLLQKRADAVRRTEPGDVLQDVRLFMPDAAVDEYTPAQALMVSLYTQLAEMQYRRHRGMVFRQIFTADGHPTRAWERVCTVKEFLHQHCGRLTHPERWRQLTRPHVFRTVEEFLTEGTDPGFPEVSPNRHRYSFRNGVFDVDSLTFTAYADPGLSRDFATCKFFDVDFEPGLPPVDARQPAALLRELLARPGLAPATHDELRGYLARCAVPGQREALLAELRETLPLLGADVAPLMPNPLLIDTPAINRIFDHQGLPQEVILWIWVMMGRMFFPLKSRDKWQTILFVKGIGGTGKSTLLEVVERFFQPDDVSVIGAKVEERFGLSAALKSLAWFCYEMKDSHGLGQAELQQMISGERMTIPEKFKEAASSVWTAPGMLAGNEPGGWADSSGAIARRLMVVVFGSPVQQADTHLFDAIEQEMGQVIKKAAYAYQAALEMVGTDGVWTHLPDYFRKTRRDLQAQINPLVAFLSADDYVVLQPGAYLLEREFLALFAEYRREAQISDKKKMSAEDFVSILAEAGVRLETTTREYGPMRQPVTGKFLVGIAKAADRPPAPAADLDGLPQRFGGLSTCPATSSAPQGRVAVGGPGPSTLEARNGRHRLQPMQGVDDDEADELEQRAMRALNRPG